MTGMESHHCNLCAVSFVALPFSSLERKESRGDGKDFCNVINKRLRNKKKSLNRYAKKHSIRV